MKILMISAEVFPFAKTGGLADAVAALAKALSEKGNDVKIVMPRYYKIDRKTVFFIKEGRMHMYRTAGGCRRFLLRPPGKVRR